MAINYSTIEKNQKEKDNAPLNEDELAYVSKVEKYIDDEIVQKFEISKIISIDLTVFSCDYDPFLKTVSKFRDARKAKMKKELETRYSKAGWRVKYEYGDDRSMCSADYAVLSKKTRQS